MCESSDGVQLYSGQLSRQEEDEWLKKAVEQIENGMNITVDYLGKVELSRSLSEEPDPEKRVDIIISCLRIIAKEAGILEEDVIITDSTSEFLRGAKLRAKPPRLAALNVSIKGFGLALVDANALNPFISWHQVGEVAFAHTDPENENIVGYYATKKATGKRFCYCIRTKCGSHILACMKLAFTLHEQQMSNSNIDLNTVVQAMTPSPTSPSDGGTYKLLRISSPSEDSKELVHKEILVPAQAIHRQILQMPKISSRAVREDFSRGSSPSSVTNLYLNVLLPAQTNSPHSNNPYHVQHVYKGMSNYFNFHEKSPILEKIEEQPFWDASQEEEEIAQAPPVPPTPLKPRPRDKLNLHELHDKLGGLPAKQTLFPEININIKDKVKPKVEAPKEVEEPEETGEKRTRLYFGTALDEYGREVLATLDQKRKKVAFRTIRERLRIMARAPVALKKKLGTLRSGVHAEDVSEYSSLNSRVFDGSLSEANSTPSSTDSGVMELDELFVFQPVSGTKIAADDKSPTIPKISPARFAQISEYIEEEPWFHGTLTRDAAECRLVKSGEFLVRQSSSQPGQFILTALRRKTVHHICLVNRQGHIRSYGNEFGSIIQLIQYHFSTQTPMCSRTTAVLLVRPVARPF